MVGSYWPIFFSSRNDSYSVKESSLNGLKKPSRIYTAHLLSSHLVQFESFDFSRFAQFIQTLRSFLKDLNIILLVVVVVIVIVIVVIVFQTAIQNKLLIKKNYFFQLTSLILLLSYIYYIYYIVLRSDCSRKIVSLLCVVD